MTARSKPRRPGCRAVISGHDGPSTGSTVPDRSLHDESPSFQTDLRELNMSYTNVADKRAAITGAVRNGVEKALQIQQPIVDAHVARIRRSRPDAPPAEVITSLEKQFLASVTAIGAASGGTAAAPGVGTAVAFGLTAFEIGGVVEATALFALAVAEVHGVRVTDLERRRTLVTAILFGESAASFVEKAVGRTGKYWGNSLVKAIPMTVINKVNKTLGPRFVTKWGTRQGVLVLGREVPFGIGAGIGAAGNFLIGQGSVRAARRAFGPAPATWPELPRAIGDHAPV